MYLPDLSLFAAQRCASDRWAIRTPCDDPVEPAVHVVAVFEVPEGQEYSSSAMLRSNRVIRAYRAFQTRVPKTRAEIGDIVWPREELLAIARLLDQLAPPSAFDPERYHLQKSELSHQLRRLAARRHA